MNFTKKQYYDEVIKPSEPKEFTQWFELWNGKESEYVHDSDLHEQYLTERQYAFDGWIACANPDIRNDIPALFGKVFEDRALKFIKKYNR